METSRKTRPGVLMWTPAPVLNSPTSSLTEDSWKEEDDFNSQMDENGIIGLEEVLEKVELEEMSKNKPQPPEPAAPEESEPSRFVKETKPEELSSSLRELWHQTLSSEDQQARWFKALMENETLRQRNNKQITRNCPEEENDGEEDEMEHDRGKKHELISTSAGLGAAAGLTCGVNLLDVGPADVSDYPYPGFQPASPIKASFLPHLFHLTAEELAAAPGIEVETFPDFSESLSESRCSHTSTRSSPHCPELNLRASPQPAASLFEQFISNHYNLLSPNPAEASEKPHPSPIKTKKLSPETSRTRSLSRASESKQQLTARNRSSKIPRRVRDDAAEVDELRSQSHQTPDFSKVEPRVNFPKSGYKPPRSKQTSTRTSLSHGPPMAFKSPADIVKDVLFNNSDGYSTSSDSIRTPASAARFTVPLEFRCRQQATTLLQQLQEDHSKLLTKYAEAENTIDRLRLEAKVNLNSDPPKAGPSVHSGLNLKASEFLRLDFSQAQRAEISSARLCPGTHSTQRENSDSHPSNPPSGQQLTNVLFSQAEKFLQQLLDSDDLLKSGNFTAFQKIEVLSQLSEGLDSLERSYLLAQDEHKLLLQRGGETCCFDPERELEGLIFQCGLHMEELKEQICVPSSSLPQSSSEDEKTLTHSQSPPEPSLVSDAAEVETSSTSKSDEEEDEETLKAVYQRPLIGKHTGVHPESTKPVDHPQILKEHPKLPKYLPSSDLNTPTGSGNKEEEQNGQRTGNSDVLKISPQRKVESDQDSPVRTRRQRSSRVSLPSNIQSSVTSVLPARSRRRLAMRRTPSSSPSSLPDTASQRRGSKAQTGTRRVLSQDGIISPETDSGFVGSESSQLTPAGAPSLLQQRATESVSVPQDVNSRSPQPASPPSSPSLSHTVQESTVSSQLDPNQPWRTRRGQRRHIFSSSPQRYDSHRRHNRAVSRTSEVWIETPTGSEVEQSDRYSRSVDSPLVSHSDSPPAACCLHGDPQRALSSRQGGNHNEAIVTLQAEVDRLKEKVENCLRNRTPLSSVAAPPSAQRSCFHHNNSAPSIRSEGIWSEESLGRRETQEGDEVDQESALRQTARARSAAQKQKAQQDFWLRSALEPSTSQFQVSRCTQTSAASHGGSLVHSRKTQTWQHSVSDTEEKAVSRDQSRLCPQCLINVRGRAEGPLGGDRYPSSLSRCSRCGGLKTHKFTETDHLKQNPFTHQNFQPAESPDRDANRRYVSASPSVLHFMPVCPPQLLLCSAAFHTSPDITAASSGTRRPEERKRGKTRRSLSVDRSLDSSLNTAITAARHMKHTSRHMARSLASGLQHHELLTMSYAH